MQVAVFNQAGRIYCYLKDIIIKISLLVEEKVTLMMQHWFCF